MRKIARVDENQGKIVKDLRKCGYSVKVTSQLGNGFGDIIVGANKRNYIFEIKDPDKPKSARKLTPDEELFHETWKGQIDKVETIDDILKIIENLIQKGL